MLKTLFFSILTIVTGFVAVICLAFVIGIALAWPPGADWSDVSELCGFFAAMLGSTWLAWFFNTKLTPEAHAKAKPWGCERCGRDAPTMKVSLNRHVGVIVLMFHRAEGGHFCKKCIEEYFWSFTPITALAGWWGPLSVIVTPIVLANNVYVYLRSRFLHEPEENATNLGH
jgi:hypothetical protein